MLIASLGCTGSVVDWATADSGGRSHDRGVTQDFNQSPPAIEAGIVLADRASYLCWPADRLNLRPDDEIRSLESSCECVAAKVIHYHDSSARSRRAVWLEFIPEGDPEAIGSPANLSVNITIHLASGDRREFDVNLLHTRLAPGG